MPAMGRPTAPTLYRIICAAELMGFAASLSSRVPSVASTACVFAQTATVHVVGFAAEMTLAARILSVRPALQTKPCATAAASISPQTRQTVEHAALRAIE